MSWWIALAYCSALLHACLHRKGSGPSHEIADQVSSNDLRTFLFHGKAFRGQDDTCADVLMATYSAGS